MLHREFFYSHTGSRDIGVENPMNFLHLKRENVIEWKSKAALVAEWFELWPSEWMVVGSNPISGLSFDFQN